MAISQNAIIGLSILYANRAPSSSDLEYWASPAAANITWDQAVVAFATSPVAQSNYPFLAAPNVASKEQYVQQVFARAFGIAAADIPPAELTYWVGWLSAPDDNGIPNYLELPVVINQFSPASRQAALQNRADVALDFAQKMLDQGISSFTETQYGSSWSIINTVTASPASVTAAKQANTDFAIAAGAANGQTFALTAGIDIFNGTTRNDIFLGSKGFVQAADQLNGGGGTDTFEYFAADVDATALPQLTNVENVQLIGITKDLNFNFSTATGLKAVTYVSPAITDITATLPDGVALGVQNTSTVKNITGNFGNAATATLNLTNVPALDKATLNGAKIATVNVNATGGNTLTTLATDSTVVKAVNISTDKTLTIDTLLVAGSFADAATLTLTGAGSAKITTKLADKVTTIDASKLDGGLNIKAGDGDVTFTGGKGADTIEFTKDKFDTKDVLNGGDGKDKLVLNNSKLDDTLTKAINGVTNFETLSLVLDGTDATLDATKITAFKSYEFTGKASKIDVAGVTTDNTFTLVGLDNTGKDFTLVANDQKAATTTNLVLKDKSTIENFTFTAFSSSTVNVASQIDTLKSTDANKLVVKDKGTPNNTKFIVTGNQDLTLDASKATATQIGVTIDASTFTGALTATGATGDLKIAGNTLIGGKGNDQITGGLGSDSLTGNDGRDSLTGTGTGEIGDTDTFIYLSVSNSNASSLVAGKESFDVITDFKNTVAARDVLNLKSAGFSAAQLQPQAIIDPTVTTLSAAVQSASEQIKANNLGFFIFGGNTFVLGNDADATKAGATDLLIQLNGTQNLIAANFA
ncbi:MAG: hypothetical protein DWQ51_04025 [Microcystis wesenbergii TW10]|uniref:Calcium-binding protein n=1 Tax=Microcystis wesenbergii TW10 TaxID=2060474 RepID=A0A3E0M907_9CHRO|nr:MAG: hypothetical protein DWQ51_04025 [Microcystis wesenbergii TW10]